MLSLLKQRISIVYFLYFRKCDGLNFDFAVQDMNVQYLKQFYGIPWVKNHSISH